MPLSDVQARIAAALAAAERPLDAVSLIAVSKVQPEARVRAVLEAGHRIFGENRVQEAKARWTPLREAYRSVELHLVGPLQSNKARAAVELFDVIHTVDRERIARRIVEAAEAVGRAPRVFVQVNTGREPQKAGVAPEGLAALLRACAGFGLAVDGLMCIPPIDEAPRAHFRMLRDLAAAHGLPKLSMGMSEDFEIAIAEGATHVRVGSAIFGAREG